MRRSLELDASGEAMLGDGEVEVPRRACLALTLFLLSSDPNSRQDPGGSMDTHSRQLLQTQGRRHGSASSDCLGRPRRTWDRKSCSGGTAAEMINLTE